MVDDECKDVRGEIKEALDREGKEEQQEGSGEIPGSDDSQKSLNTLQTHAHVPDRRVAVSRRRNRSSEQLAETPLRRQKMKGFCDVVKPSTHPRVTGTTTWVAIRIIGKGIYGVKGNDVWNRKIVDPADA
ncbi:hypothetical protein ACSQ67_001083 [Phaseolus vulgaris]